MTNHWADMANSTNVVVWGANPVENHPACIAHVNRARFPEQFFAQGDLRSQKQPAKLIVIDPRKTRTALQVDETRGDRYVRIRPGTDIAFGNGLMRYIIEQMESPTSPVSAAQKTAFFAYLNKNNAGTFFTDGNATAASASASTAMGDAGGSSVYSDARFLVNGAATDYVRDRIVASTGNITAIAPDNTTISDFPLKAATVDADPNTVYNRLKAHVASYTLDVVADICGCTTGDIEFVANAFIENSRCSTTAVGALPANDTRNPGYRATTMLYAMGLTQHTCGAENVKMFATLQTLMGNMGRGGGGINALRGIHNVQGSTDMGLLFGNIPAYSGNPSFADSFGQYMDKLWGTPVSGTGGKVNMNGSYDDAYRPDQMGLQQRGFYNMTLKFFGDYASIHPALASSMADRAKVDACYSLWPKGNGDDHITMFRQMQTGVTKAAVVWGQNPAVTEPNQGAVREGLKNLDLLVCVDMFGTETAMVSRKTGGLTYLIPAASHVEKAGSATNSGRTLQWRYQASDPLGNAKDDTEILLRFAKALNDNVVGGSAFSHILQVWTDNAIAYDTSVFKQLYANPYMGGAATFDAASVSGEIWPVRKWADEVVAPSTVTLTGSEAVAERAYQEMSAPTGSGGTLWIYTGAYNTGASWTADNIPAAYTGGWQVKNRAKSRDRRDPAGGLGFHGWGYSWLVNRRVFYNNGEVLGDVTDFFMGPDSCSRLFVSTSTAKLNYSRWYRTIHRLADRPDVVVAGDTTSPHFVGALSYAGRFPGHTEPYETPRADLAADWGRNTSGTAWNCVKDDTRVTGRGYVNGVGGKTVTDPDPADFPLVLTTIRCVEHFQGGPITRNNWWNVELEPEPWVEINIADATARGINTGDMVRIITARVVDDTGAYVEPALYGDGFRARVGAGLQPDQMVGAGVVAIPWHWGDQGLSTGSRANDLTIDASDANTKIPEYKACLCQIEKM